MPMTAKPEKRPDLGPTVNVSTRWVDPEFNLSRVVIGDDVGRTSQFSEQPVYRCELANDGATLDVIGFDASTRYHYIGQQADGRLGYQADSGATLALKPYDKSAAEPAAAVRLSPSLEIRPAKPYDAASSASSGAADTFEMGVRLMWDDWIFKGHNLFETNPRDLQVDGVKQFVFAFPSNQSHDYFPTTDGTKAHVPFGVFFVGDDVSAQRTTNHSATSESQYQQSWSYSVGAELSVPEVSFSANKTFKNKMSNGVSLGAGSTMSIGRYYTHSLVMDLAHASLTPDFLGKAEAACTAIEQSDPNLSSILDGLVKQFGTHYAHSATFGGMTMHEYHFSKSAISQMLEQGEDVSVSAGIEFAKVTASSDTSTSNSYTHTSDEGIDDFESVGGSPSSNGGFTVGDKAVPIQADLRLISDLLNPVLCPDLDPDTLSACRQKLKERLVAMAAALPRFAAKSLLPLPVFVVELVQLERLSEFLNPSTAPTIEIHLDAPAGDGKQVIPVTGSQMSWTATPATASDTQPVGIRAAYVIKAATAGDAINLRMAIKGRWKSHQDRDVHDAVIASLPFSQFAPGRAEYEARVPRDMGSIVLRLRYGNDGGDFGATA
jgi:hypothetical protein